MEQTRQENMGRFPPAIRTEFWTVRVNAYSSEEFVLSFGSDRAARVCISGDGDTDLDLYVFNEDGDLVGSSMDDKDEECVSWTPCGAGTFRIEVRNLGDVWNLCKLWANSES